MADRVEDTGSVQAEWRIDPKKSGISLCGGDIGTHAMMQLRYVTGLEVPRIQAFLETFVKGRRLDDHFTAYCELSNGGKAMIRTSQIAIGHKNDLGIEVCGEKGVAPVGPGEFRVPSDLPFRAARPNLLEGPDSGKRRFSR